MNKIRQIIRKLLFEVHGKQVSIHNFSGEITTDTMEVLRDNFEKMSNGREWKFAIEFKSPENTIKDTNIDMIKIYVSFKFSNEFKIGGNFTPDKTILLDDDNYEVNINLKLETNTIENLLPKIKSLISHELNHAFVYIKDIGGKLKANLKNKSNKFTQMELQHLFENNPSLKEFSKMIYLANPYEVQAIVQQSASELEHINNKTPEETIESLLQYNPLRDAKIMMAYNLDEINKLDKEIIEIFVKKFNDNIKSFSKEDNPKTIYDINKFLEYWISIIHSSGHKLARKIYKLVADKHQIHEAYVYEQTSDNVYYRIFGEYY